MGLFGSLFGRGRGAATPFEADPFLDRLVQGVLDCCEYAVFAGEGAAAMAERVAKRHTDRECLACEPAGEPFYAASSHTEKVKNLYLFNQRPREFLLGLKHDKPYLMERDTLVVLNVPGGGSERRVFAEAAFIASTFAAPFLLLLGCRVPGNDAFAFDTNRGRECSLKNLRPCFVKTPHTLYFPAYSVPQSRSRMLKGWCLATLGRNAHHAFPEEIMALLTKPEPRPASEPGAETPVVSTSSSAQGSKNASDS